MKNKTKINLTKKEILKNKAENIKKIKIKQVLSGLKSMRKKLKELGAWKHLKSIEWFISLDYKYRSTGRTLLVKYIYLKSLLDGEDIFPSIKRKGEGFQDEWRQIKFELEELFIKKIK